MRRVLDGLVAAAGLLLLAPLLVAIGLAVGLSSPGGALFRQTRVGRHGEPFELVKFRTMRHDPSGPRVTARDDPRITGVGRILRRTKLDELPELWNVVRGEMALVGPRPEVPEYVDLDDERWRRVLAVRPGLTDPVTLHLRDEEALLAAAGEDRLRFYEETLLPQKLEEQIDYLERRTAWSDLGVLARTLWTLLRPPASGPGPGSV